MVELNSHHIYNTNPTLKQQAGKTENMSQANKQDMENKGKGALVGRERERPVCVPGSLLLMLSLKSSPHSLPGEIDTRLGISLSLPETTE